MVAAPAPTLGAVLLAAGLARRLGGRPKCLLRLDGQPLVRCVAQALRAAGVDDLVVVAGEHRDAIDDALQGLPCTLVVNLEPAAGPVVSQRLGLQALRPGHAAVIVALADQPLVDAQAVGELLQAWSARAPGVDVLVPQVDGRRGNPVLLSAAVCREVLAAGPETGARQWQQQHPGRVAFMPSARPAFVVDIDSPQDLAEFERRTGRVLRWPDLPA